MDCLLFKNGLEKGTIMSVSMSTLGSTLLALSIAPKSERGVPQVTPRLWGDTGFSCGGVLNRLVDTVYAFGERTLRQSAIKQTVEKSSQAFAERVEEVIFAYQSYKRYLQGLEDGYLYKSDDIRKMRHIITDWNCIVQPPQGMRLLEMIQRANASTEAIVGKRWFSRSVLLTYQPVFEEISRAQHIIDMEENTEAPFPLKIFHKLCKGPTVNLSIVEEEKLKLWISRVNLCSHLKVHEVHRALRSLVEQMGMAGVCHEQRPSALAFLEYHLFKKDLKVLAEPDAKHLRWRRSLEEQKKVTLAGKTYELANRLGDNKKNSGIDHHWVYPIRGNSNFVLIANVSEPSLLIEAVEQLAHPSAIPSARLKISDIGGRYALYERLKYPLIGYEWSYDNDGITPTDKKALKSLVKLLDQLVSMEKTPDIALDDVMFDQNYELKLVRNLKPGSCFNFDAIVRFAYEASNGNLFVFKYLLENSLIGQHELVDFYTNIVKDAVAQKPKGVNDVAWRNQMSFALIMDRARNLHRKVGKMANRCYRMVTTLYKTPPHLTREQIEGEISRTLLQAYEESIGAGILWPRLDKEVVPRVAKSLELRRR